MFISLIPHCETNILKCLFYRLKPQGALMLCTSTFFYYSLILILDLKVNNINMSQRNIFG